ERRAAPTDYLVDPVEDVLLRPEDRRDTEREERDRNDRGLQPFDAELDLQIAHVQLAGEEEPDPTESHQHPADEGTLPPPVLEATALAAAVGRLSGRGIGGRSR